MVYALHVEQLERAVLAERQVAAVLLAAGAKEVTLPTLESARDEFEASLVAESKQRTLSPELAELREVLGVGRG